VSEPPSVTRLPTRVWHLELEALRPSASVADVHVQHAAVPYGALNRFFYVEVGRDFDWIDRLGWTAGRWQAWAERVETWLVLDRGTPAGYAELVSHDDGAVEIAFFGLLEPFRGRGIGGGFLTRMAERASELSVGGRVLLQTCELDGPHALRNYEARGFRVVREAIEARGRRVPA
jgi:GNAT superfamily N-acetyltransferase